MLNTLNDPYCPSVNVAPFMVFAWALINGFSKKN